MSDRDVSIQKTHRVIDATTSIVAAYVGNAKIQRTEVFDLIRSVHTALAQLGADASKMNQPLVPAVPINKSVSPNYLICLEDGKKLKMLKRHLRTSFGMTPEEYRAKWNLPADYPMAAPNYTKSRSEFAKRVGFGTKRSRGSKG